MRDNLASLVKGNLASLGALGALLALVALLVVPMMSVGGSAADSRTERDTGATARMKDVDGDSVGVVRFEALKGGKVEVWANLNGVVPRDQFHGFHLHTTGKCNPNAVDPETDEKVPFFSAGGHFDPGSDIHSEHAGDFPVLLVMHNGQAQEKFVTDRFKLSQLFDKDGSAVIIHEGRDNYANIPATTDGEKRYHSHLEDVFGPDSLTKATGDAGDRFACGVVRKAS
jgi:Cu-Zn family superoxide dismutase